MLYRNRRQQVNAIENEASNPVKDVDVKLLNDDGLKLVLSRINFLQQQFSKYLNQKHHEKQTEVFTSKISELNKSYEKQIDQLKDQIAGLEAKIDSSLKHETQPVDVPESVKELSTRYLAESDPFTSWFDSDFQRSDDKKDYVSLKDVFEIYKRSYLYENLSKADKRSQNYRWFINLICSHHTLKLFYKEVLKLSQTSKARNVLIGYKFKEEEQDEGLNA